MKRLVLLFAVLSTPAMAQQQATQSPTEQAIGQKLGEEINEGLQLRAALIAEKAKNAELQKQIDELKASKPSEIK